LTLGFDDKFEAAITTISPEKIASNNNYQVAN
jgi:hypothetical protein